MSKLSFTVSARAAQLIGRQNFSTAEGAILELVKNSYDADAKLCFVIFDIIYETIPTNLNEEDFVTLQKEYSKISTFYIAENSRYKLNHQFIDSEDLKNFFFSKNSIYIIDNGEGMDEDTIQNSWMVIGTGKKEYDFLSHNKRIKTGAKGIGRFALDRLGFFTEMWTNTEKKDSSLFWKMDWRQFENVDKTISQIEATLESYNVDVKKKLLSNLNNDSLSKLLNGNEFVIGTVIKISGLKDIWNDDALKAVFKSLEALIPPRELDIEFNVHLSHLQNPTNFGFVETAYFNDFDYKVVATYNSEKKQVNLSIHRDELDLQKVKTHYANLFEKQAFPYDLKTLESKNFEITKSIYELTKWEDNENNNLLFSDVGSFSFSFYFLKLQTSQKENYPYKEVNAAERKEILRRFGGVKIYRDSFRVRPYGDNGNDWLDLGERASQSPASAGQRVGDWRIRTYQIAGLINISRIENKNLADKSDRGGLIENSAFDTFKKIVLSIINDFEIDRSKILNPFYIDAEQKKEQKRKAEIQKEAEKIAHKIIETREKEIKQRTETFNFNQNERTEKDKNEYKELISKVLSKVINDDEKDAEIAQVRNLASLGLIVASFAHELKSVRNNTDEINNLEKVYAEIVSEKLKETQLYRDGISILSLLKRDGEKTKHWVDYSLSAVKKDKRKRTEIDFKDYFNNLKNQWNLSLQDKNITLETIYNIEDKYDFRAFEMDLDTIFSNLIANSIDSFQNVKGVIIERKIFIDISVKNNIAKIVYSDNGNGIKAGLFSDKDDVFLPFVTTKKGGTGLGMYLVKNVVNDNNGTIELLERENGFGVEIIFSTRNN